MIANVWILDPSTSSPTIVALDPIRNVQSDIFDITNSFYTITTDSGKHVIPVVYFYRTEFINE